MGVMLEFHITNHSSLHAVGKWLIGNLWHLNILYLGLCPKLFFKMGNYC